MELNWLKYFYETARVQSVTLAGQALRVSQPAVTKTIRQLEEQLGYRLFMKSGRNIKLTTEGERLYLHCVPLFKRLDQVKQLGQESDKNWAGTIRLAASDNLCNHILPDVLVQLRNELPKASYTIYAGSSKEIKQRIITGEVDFGIFYTELTVNEQHLLQEEKIASVPFVAVTASKLGARFDLKQLKSHDLTYVGVRFADYTNTLPEQWIVKKLNVDFSRNIQINSKETQKQMVLAGLGFGIFPYFMVQKEVVGKKLTVVQGSKQSLGLRVVYRSDDTLTKPQRMLIDRVKDAL